MNNELYAYLILAMAVCCSLLSYLIGRMSGYRQGKEEAVKRGMNLLKKTAEKL